MTAPERDEFGLGSSGDAGPPDVAESPALVVRLREGLTERAAAATAPHVTVGDRAVLCECEHPRFGPLAGVAHRPPDGSDSGVNASDTVATLLESATASAGSVDRAVGLATANALSAPDIEWQRGDPMASLSTDVDIVATVGLFRPAFRKFSDVEVRVVERPAVDVDVDESTLPAGVSVRVFRPDERVAAFTDADVCFITGATLVYGGIDDYLAAASQVGVPVTALVGATASFRPALAFEAGADLLAGVRVRAPERVREGIVAGDCGTDLHDAGLEKVYVAARPDHPGVQFDRHADGLTTDDHTAVDDEGNDTPIASRDRETAETRTNQETQR